MYTHHVGDVFVCTTLTSSPYYIHKAAMAIAVACINGFVVKHRSSNMLIFFMSDGPDDWGGIQKHYDNVSCLYNTVAVNTLRFAPRDEIFHVFATLRERMQTSRLPLG